MLCAIDAEYTEIQGIASGVFLCGMRPLHAGCDGLVLVAFSMAEETGRLAHTNKTIQMLYGQCNDSPVFVSGTLKTLGVVKS